MFNMATMAADECRTDKSERAYFRFIDKVSAILGRRIELGSADESDAGDLYSAGCTPAEAAAEMSA